jgi:adenylosuccinate synthase
MKKRAFAVIGAGYGDEEKGLMTDYLAHKHIDQNTVVIRFNGGAQAGHTVWTPSGQKHVFSHFGAGTFSNVPTYLSSDFIINPVLFLKEYEILEHCVDNIECFISPACRITTPFDMAVNQVIEQARSVRHGSCGVGIYETVLREKHISFQAVDLFNKSKQSYNEKMQEILKYCIERLRQHGIYDVPDFFTKYANDIIEKFWHDSQKMISHVSVMQASMAAYSFNTFIFEGAQGLMLSEAHGVFPHLTPSDPGCSAPISFCSKNKITDLSLCYVSRVYATRHGNGPLANEMSPQEIGIFQQDLEKETNIRNDFQGSFRYGRLDTSTLINVINADKTSKNNANVNLKVHLAFTCVDQIKPSYWDKIEPELTRVVNAVQPDILYVCKGNTRNTVTEVNGGSPICIDRMTRAK